MHGNTTVTSHAWSTIITSLISSLQQFCGFVSHLGRHSLYRNNQHIPSQSNLATKLKCFEAPSARGCCCWAWCRLQKVGLLMLGHHQPSACFHFHRWLLHSTPLQSATCDHRSPAVRVYTLYTVSPSFCPTMYWTRVTKVLLWLLFHPSFSFTSFFLFSGKK